MLVELIQGLPKPVRQFALALLVAATLAALVLAIYAIGKLVLLPFTFFGLPAEGTLFIGVLAWLTWSIAGDILR